MFYDVTIPISHGMTVYPGDLEVIYERQTSIEKEGYNWSRISAGTHIGTHMDAPVHFIKDGATMDDLPMDLMISEASVVETQAEMISREVLEHIKLKDWRVVFFKTKNQELWKRKEFVPDFVSITPDGAEYLVKKGVRLVGIDYRSIETHYTHDYPVHKTLLGSGAFIIEGLYLNNVTAGRYKLYCLPLKLDKGDGGPVRAVLEG